MLDHKIHQVLSVYIGNSFTEPSLRDLVVALRGVDWHQLGTQLGVPQEELERIDEECHDVSRKLNKMLNYWLKNEEPSWEKIVKALERTGRHGNLITELKFSYCSFPLVSSSSATVISVDDKINMKQSNYTLHPPPPPDPVPISYDSQHVGTVYGW